MINIPNNVEMVYDSEHCTSVQYVLLLIKMHFPGTLRFPLLRFYCMHENHVLLVIPNLCPKSNIVLCSCLKILSRACYIVIRTTIYKQKSMQCAISIKI